MKFKKIFAAVLAGAVALSSLSLSASAAAVTTVPSGTETVLYTADLDGNNTAGASWAELGNVGVTISDTSIMAKDNVYAKLVVDSFGDYTNEDGSTTPATEVLGWDVSGWLTGVKWYNNYSDSTDAEENNVSGKNGEFEVNFLPFVSEGEIVSYIPISDFTLDEYNQIGGNLQNGHFSSVSLGSLEIVEFTAGSPVDPENDTIEIVFDKSKDITFNVVDASGWGNPDFTKAAQAEVLPTIDGVTTGTTTFGDLKTKTVKLTDVDYSGFTFPEGITSADVSVTLFAQYGENWEHWTTSNNETTWDLSGIENVPDDAILQKIGYQMTINGDKGGINDMEVEGTFKLTLKSGEEEPGGDEVDTSTWKPAANGFTKDWNGWSGCSADAGTLNFVCTIQDIMNANNITDIADFGGFIAQVWNGTVGAEVSYTVIIEAADGTQKAKDSGTTTTVDNDGTPETNLKQYATEACGGNMVFAATDKIKIAVAAGDTPPEIPDDEPGQEETTKTLTLTVIDASGWGKPDVQKAAQKNTSMTPTGFTVGATKYGDVKNATVKLNGAEITNISIPGVDLTDSENITFSLYAQWGDNWTWTSGAADGWNMSDITGVADSDVLKEFGYQINVNGTVGGINDMTLGDTITVTIKYTDFVATGISGGDTPGGDNPGGDTPGTPSIPSRPSTPSEPEETVKFEDGKNETGAVVEAPKDAFEKPDDITFNAASVAEETKDEIFTFDLSFTDKDGNKVQPKSAVTVKLPVPAALTGKTVYVYHVEENGTYTEISCKVENGMVVFSAKSFSKYVITSQKLNANGEPVADQPGTTDPGTNNPGNTNEPNVNTGVGSVAVVLGVTAVAAGAMIVSKKRK